MSKTRKTRPLPVRLVDRKDKDVIPVEHHDHSHGECDLPTLKEYLKNPHGHTKCHWVYESFVGLHSCSLCTDPLGRHLNNKRRRIEDKKEAMAEFNDMT